MNIDKKVTLSIPMKMSLDKAKDFVKKKANWIKNNKIFMIHLQNKRKI